MTCPRYLRPFECNAPNFPLTHHAPQRCTLNIQLLLQTTHCGEINNCAPLPLPFRLICLTKTWFNSNTSYAHYQDCIPSSYTVACRGCWMPGVNQVLGCPRKYFLFVSQNF